MLLGEKVLITPLGGVGEVGRNCFLYEYKDHALVIDCGIMPQKEENGAGGDLLWENPHYPKLEILDEKIREGKKISALITHAHLDHIGAIAELIRRRIPIHISRFAQKFFVARYLDSFIFEEDIKIANLITLADGKSSFQFGDFSITCFPVPHSIPNTFGVSVKVGGKNILHLTDFKFQGLEEGRSFLENTLLDIKNDCGTIDALLLDTLNAEIPGYTPPERKVIQSLEEIISQTKQGKIFITFFSSNIQRMEEILKVCLRLNRPVRVLGQGMKTSRDEFCKINTYKDRERKFTRERYGQRPYAYPGEVILLAGSQGEESSHLWKALVGGWLGDNGRYHKSDTRIYSKDTIVLSSRCIPGNEKPVRELLEGISRRRAKIILHEGESRKLQLPFRVKEKFVHVSGHGYQGDQLRVIEIAAPKKIIPVHAERQKTEIFAGLLGDNSQKIIIPSLGETIII